MEWNVDWNQQKVVWLKTTKWLCDPGGWGDILSVPIFVNFLIVIKVPPFHQILPTIFNIAILSHFLWTKLSHEDRSSRKEHKLNKMFALGRQQCKKQHIPLLRSVRTNSRGLTMHKCMEHAARLWHISPHALVGLTESLSVSGNAHFRNDKKNIRGIVNAVQSGWVLGGHGGSTGLSWGSLFWLICDLEAWEACVDFQNIKMRLLWGSGSLLLLLAWVAQDHSSSVNATITLALDATQVVTGARTGIENKVWFFSWLWRLVC